MIRVETLYTFDSVVCLQLLKSTRITNKRTYNSELILSKFHNLIPTTDSIPIL